MEKKNWKENEIEEYLKKSAGQEEIPEKLKPENVKKFLEESTNRKKKRNFRKWYGAAAMAACFALVLLAANNMKGIQKEGTKTQSTSKAPEVVKDGSGTTYEELYHFFETESEARLKEMEEVEEKDTVVYESADSQAKEDSSGNSADREESYAQTNRQEAEVDEADIMKNDGRYLYQIVRNQDHSQSIQIVDTDNGLKEVARIEGFDNIYELYIWKDTLVVRESGWVDSQETTWVDGQETTDLQKQETRIAYDTVSGNEFQKIYIYDIKERENPKEEKSFTIKGSNLDSRLTDGYLYCFVLCDVEKLEDMKEYEDYVPVLEGEAMKASSIYLPNEAQALSYLVMVSVDLRQPETFKDAKAIVASADRVYVTGTNIYLADGVFPRIEGEGSYSNRTNITRFSYEKGMIKKEAEGSVKGRLMDDMAINEADGYLRLAVTVDSYKKKSIKDDIFEYFIGYTTSSVKRDNSLYVLDEKLKLVGKIEGLAEEEQIYSARFMGDIGYFVTFRQVDPLFSVDLSDPQNPKILGELKISGFSEYLHFYDKDLLLGIGMEADETTGRTEGMKLSMFDISNPASVKEQDKYNLSQYDYSEGLYNYKAVMIDTQKNLFGFYAEGYEEESEDYLLFAYEDGAFQQKMKIPCDRRKNEIYTHVRGTYIGDVFYLMYSDGRIESYSLLDGSLLKNLL